MAREVWAVYSVKDHTVPFPFVADLLLCDRLRVPVPTEKGWSKWVENGWDPQRQASLLEVLGDRVKPVTWDSEMRAQWENRYTLALESASETKPDAFKMTRMQLIEALPRSVTGVDTVAAYPSFEDLQDDSNLQILEQAVAVPYGQISAALSWQFAVPAPKSLDRPPELTEEKEVLAVAKEISDKRAFSRNRRAYWRWLNEFTGGVVTDVETVRDAVQELTELMDEQQQLVRDERIDFSMRTVFLATSVTLGMVQGPFSPTAIGVAIIALGQFAWTQRYGNHPQTGDLTPDEARVAAMFCQIDRDIRRRLFRQ